MTPSRRDCNKRFVHGIADSQIDAPHCFLFGHGASISQKWAVVKFISSGLLRLAQTWRILPYMLSEKQQQIAEFDSKHLGLVILEVNRKLSAMKSEHLGAMLSETRTMMRSVRKSEQIMGTLLRVQVLEALGERADLLT